MTDKPSKKKAKKASQPSVLGSLPATRPDRLGRTRAAAGDGVTAVAKPKPAAAKPRATAKPKAATTPRAAATPKRKVAAAPRTAAAMPPAGTAAQRTAAARPEAAPPRSEPPSSPGVVGTTVQAVGEVAQIGFTVGRQILGRVASRIPRP